MGIHGLSEMAQVSEEKLKETSIFAIWLDVKGK